MSETGLDWPVVGKMSRDLEEHSKLLMDEASNLCRFAAPTEDNILGKQCPHETLIAFCTNVMVYVDKQTETLTRGKENVECSTTRAGPFKTPLKAQSAQKPQHESPFPSIPFRQISQPLTPQHHSQEPRNTPSSERARPLNVDTFGVLVLYVPSSFDVTNQKRAIDGITSVNKGFIPGIAIKSIEWLIPEWTKTKHYSNLLVEFKDPQHANAAIREQLLVGRKVLGCEYYERDSRLRQCFFCQQYRHLETQCQATKPYCGRCAGRHVTGECNAREEARNFHCALCGGGHRAWDNACHVRQQELERVRNARANAPKYHAVAGQVPQEDGTVDGDTPSREFAGTRRYSPDFLVEVNLRGGRKSYGRIKGQESRLDEDVANHAQESPCSANARAGQVAQTAIMTPQSTRKNSSGVDRFNEWIRSRLLTLGIEPYTPLPPKPDLEIEDVGGPPATPTPIGRRPSDIWEKFAQFDTPSKSSERTRKSLVSTTNQGERSLSEKAANIKKIRSSGSWR